jgi:cysteine desulfurase / selenocysteine lyase
VIATDTPTAAPGLAALRERIVGIDCQVPVLGGSTDGSMRPYVNLDNAASTPVLREVLDAVNDFMPWYSSVHRGAGFKSRLATQAFEDARDTVARFVGANPREHTVIFGKNATEAINKLSYRLPLTSNDVVLVSLLEHHSNDLPWRIRSQVERIGVDALGHLDEAHFDHLLRRFAGRVKLVAVTGASNVTGSLPDVHALAAKAHAAGAQIVVDCAQLAAHGTIDIGTLDDPEHLDYVVLSAHKMYAPFGCGALIGRRDTFERGEPEYRGGGTIDFVATDAVDWAAAPERDEAGTPNVVGAVALARAMRSLQAIGMDSIARHETRLCAHALRRLAQVDGLRIHGDADPHRAGRRLGVITFNLASHSHFLVAAALAAEHAIGVRSGCFCAHPYVARLLGLSETDLAQARRRLRVPDRSRMPGMVRISLGLYNTAAEIDRLAAALAAIARGDLAARYVQDCASGEFTAEGETVA